MKIHFIASRGAVAGDIDFLRSITDFILHNGHELAREWIESAYQGITDNSAPINDWKEIYRLNTEAIARCDSVIAEVSVENFAVGYQVAMAVHLKKPVLLLRHTDSTADTFAVGVEGSWVEHKTYDKESEAIAAIQAFIEEHDISSKDMRFNFFIDRPIYNYLRWESQKTGKNKSEIIRELIMQQIEEEQKNS